MKWIILIPGLALFLLLLGFILVWPHLWFKMNTEAFIIDGEPASNVELYVSPSEEIRLRNGGLHGYEDYVIRVEQQEVGIPNSDNFISLLLCVYSIEKSPPIVASSNRIKIERDMAVDFQRDWVEFTTSDAKRLRLHITKLRD